MMIALQTLLRPWKLVFVLTGLICILIAEATSACDFNPTAVMNHETGAVFIDDDTVLLSGSQSTANNCSGYIDQYRWQVRPVGGSWTTLYTGTSSTYSYSFPTLPAGENQKDYQVRLRVRNNIFLYNTTTITVTVPRSHKSYYYLTDHLGSVRVTVNDAGDPVGWDDYYPFGLQMPGRTQNASNPNDDQKFTGYELEQQGDLGLYHAEARMYDPVIGRFMQIDPLASEFPSLTPFHYSYNNPLRFNDPTGLCPAEFGEEICEYLNQFDVFRAFFAQPKDDSDEAVAKVVEQKEHAGMFATAMEEGGELIEGFTDIYANLPGPDFDWFFSKRRSFDDDATSPDGCPGGRLTPGIRMIITNLPAMKKPF